MLRKGKPFSDGEFIKKWLEVSNDDACPKKKYLLKQSKCFAFSVALDVSTDLSKTAQFAVIIQRITDNLKVIAEFLKIANIKSTTIGYHICEEVMTLMNNLNTT